MAFAVGDEISYRQPGSGLTKIGVIDRVNADGTYDIFLYEYNGEFPLKSKVEGTSNDTIQALSTTALTHIPSVATVGSIASPGALRGTVGAVHGERKDSRGYWTEDDGGGDQFFWDAASTETDTGGDIVRPTAVGVGAPGRWKSLSVKNTGIFHVKRFGAKGTGVIGDATANTAAINAAIARINAIAAAEPAAVGSPNYDGCVLDFGGAGNCFYYVNGTFTITRCMRIRGGIQNTTGSTTFLAWTGTTAHGFVFGAGSSGASLESLQIIGSGNGLPYAWTNAEYDDTITEAGAALGSNNGCGVWIGSNNVKVRNCLFANWLYDGIHITSDNAAVLRNANDFVIEDCATSANGRHGLFVHGINSSAGVVTKLTGTGGQGGYTVYDRSFLGNTYNSCHSEGSAHAYFTSYSPINTTQFIGCYQEASDGPSTFGAGTIIVGGTWGNAYVGTNQNWPAAGGLTAVPVDMATIPGLGGIGLRGCPMMSPIYPKTSVRTWTAGAPQVFVEDGYSLTNIMDSTGGNSRLQLPDPQTPNLNLFIVKRKDATGSTVDIRTTNNRNIEGVDPFPLANNQCVLLQSDGTQYRVLANFFSNTSPALSSITVTGTDGAAGGGDLTANRTITLPAVGPGAGTIGNGFQSITLDVKGRVTAAAISLVRRGIADVDSTFGATDYVLGYTSLTATRTVTLTTGGTTTAPLQALIQDETGLASAVLKILLVPSSGTINGLASMAIATPYGSITTYCNGTNWFVVL